MMRQSIAPGPLFIVGFPRSGTTLVQQILNAHPRIAVAPETHFVRLFWERRDTFGDISTDVEWNRLLARIAAVAGLREVGFELEELRKHAVGAPRTWASALNVIMTLFAEHYGASIAGEKTPLHQVHMPLLQAWFPESRFIQVVRDPRAVINSWRSVPWSSGSVAVDALEWRSRHTRAMADLPRIQRHLTVRYEDVVTDTESAARRICDFLKVDFSEVMLRHGNRTAIGFDVSWEPWKQRSAEPVTESRIDAWRTELTPPQVFTVEAVDGTIMRQFGYLPSGHARLRMVLAPAIHMGAAANRRWISCTHRFRSNRIPPQRRILSEAYKVPSNPYGRILAQAVEAADPRLVVEGFSLRALLRPEAPALWHLDWPQNAPAHPRFIRALRLVAAVVTGVIAARLRGIGLVWTVHNAGVHDPRRAWLSELFMHWLVKRLDGWISLSKAGVPVALARYPDLAHRPHIVVRHGHYQDWYPDLPPRNEARARLSLTSSHQVLLALGRIEPYKRIPELILAFAACPGRDLRLLVAGRSRRPDLAHAVARASQADERVTFLPGYVAREDVSLLLSASDGFVMPAERVLNSGSVLLALSFGVPVLAPDTPVMRELRSDLGADAVHLYSGAIETPELRGFYNACQRVDREALARSVRAVHDWDYVGRATADFYSSLLQDVVAAPSGRVN